MKSSKCFLSEAFTKSSTTTSSDKASPTSASPSAKSKPGLHIWSRPVPGASEASSVSKRTTREVSSSSWWSKVSSPSVRRSASHSSPAPTAAPSEGSVTTVTPVLIGIERVKVYGVVVVIITLDIGVRHHLEYEVEGRHELVQTAGDLDTPVTGLGGAVREDLPGDT